MAGIEDLSGQELVQARLGKLLLETPEVRRDVLRLAKKANPKLNLPEVELEERLDAERADAIKREEKLEQQLMEERVARRKTERDAQIRAAGFTVEEIEKIIVDEKCTYETALKLAGLSKQTAEPTAGDVRFGANPPGTPVEMRPDKDWRKLQGSQLRQRSAEVAAEMINSAQKKWRAGNVA